MRNQTRYPASQLNWLRRNRNKYHYNELAPAFNQKFGTDYSTPKIYYICDSNDITSGKLRQTPARKLPDEWVNWLQKEAPHYQNYVSFRDAFNNQFGTDYKSRSAFQRLCKRVNVSLVKSESFPDFAEAHLNEVKAFCKAHWKNLTRKEFTEAFNNYFHTSFDSAICAWISGNTDRLNISPKRMPQYQFKPSRKELNLFRKYWKTMKAKDFAAFCNQTIGTHYNDRQAAHRAEWLVNNGYLKDSDVRKKKKIVRKK